MHGHDRSNLCSTKLLKKFENLSLINNYSIISVIIGACLVSSERLLHFLEDGTLLVMIMAYMGVRCLEMWSMVKMEKYQNDPRLVSKLSHSLFSY